MSSKEVKNLLKDAREAIKNKDFKVAIKKCKVRVNKTRKWPRS
jgi:hypothetical protein